MTQEVQKPFIARFTFKPSRAEDFLEVGQLVTQLEFDTLDEVLECVDNFSDAIEDCNLMCDGVPVDLSKFLK